jgi:hypothetical protein
MCPVSVLAILGIFLLMFSESFMVMYIYISNLPYFGIYYAHLFIICSPLEILKNCGKMEIFIDNAKAFFFQNHTVMKETLYTSRQTCNIHKRKKFINGQFVISASIVMPLVLCSTLIGQYKMKNKKYNT